MQERPALRFCRHCGADDRRPLGTCHVCGQDVCDSCGNRQDSAQRGRLAIHTDCLQKYPRAASSAFKFIRFVK
jgi:hypothetical protein